MTVSVVAVLLVGGSGDRFWPLARSGAEKPFLALVDEDSMLKNTVERMAPLATRILAVGAPAAREEMMAALSEVTPTPEIVREPAPRATAPALGLAALRCAADDVLVALPSDHHIPDAARFRDVVGSAVTVALRQAGIVCIGIAPSRPETAYGYIRTGDSLPGGPGFAIASFVEKPPLPRAMRLVEEGALWNSGIFVVRAGIYLQLVERYLPELHRVLMAVHHGDAEAFSEAPIVSVDHGILENCAEAFVVRGDFAWDDIGDWGALARVFPCDAAGNAVRGRFLECEARHLVVDCDAGLVAAVGVEDLVIVRRGDVVLVVKRGQERLVPRLLAQMQSGELTAFR